MARHLLVTNDYPPKTGGIQVYLHELWRRLEPQRAVVVTATSAPHTEVFDATSEIAIERIPAKTLFFPTWSAKRAIEAAITRHQPDLVLLGQQSDDGECYTIGAVVAEHLGMPM